MEDAKGRNEMNKIRVGLSKHKLGQVDFLFIACILTNQKQSRKNYQKSLEKFKNISQVNLMH